MRIGGNYADLKGESPKWKAGTYSTYDENADQHFDKSHGYTDLEYNGAFFNQALNWKSTFYYLWDRNHWYWGGNGNPDANQSRYTDTTLGTDQQLTWTMTAWNKVVAGISYEKLEKESEAVFGGQPSAPYTPGMAYKAQALYLQNSIDLMDNRINFMAAARYDRFDVGTRQAETVQIPDFEERDESYDHISPKFGIGVKFMDELLRLRANIGEGFKSPSASQLATHHISSGTTYLGNPDLRPETSLTYDLGFDLNHDFISLNVSYFHSNYEDKIVQVDHKTLPNTKTWDNHGEAEIAGFDINVEWHIGRTFDWPYQLSLWANTTYNTTYHDEETGEDLLWMSDYEVKSGLEFTYNTFSSQLTYTLVGPQKITNYDTYKTEDKDSFDFFDLTMRYGFGGHWQVRASVLNLLDERVEWVRGYVQPERNYRVGVSYSF